MKFLWRNSGQLSNIFTGVLSYVVVPPCTVFDGVRIPLKERGGPTSYITSEKAENEDNRKHGGLNSKERIEWTVEDAPMSGQRGLKSVGNRVILENIEGFEVGAQTGDQRLTDVPKAVGTRGGDPCKEA